MKIGSIVLALAGKEKDGIYVVVKLDENFAYLADGNRLSALKPKKKSLKHIKVIDKVGIPMEEVTDTNERVNARIRKYLKTKRSEYVERRCNRI